MAQAGTLDHGSLATNKYGTGVWARLSVMMFLQFAVWGSWFTVFNIYMEKTLHFKGSEIGSVYGTMALGAIIAMMIAGQLADRVLASEYLMAIFHLAGAGLMFLLANVQSFAAVWWLTFAYALVYNPTLTIANSLAFANIKDSTHFAWVRVFGTFGWIVAGVAVDYLLPAGAPLTNQPLLMCAVLSLALGLYSFLLPHTPPSGKGGDAFPFVRAFALLKDPGFAIFFGLSFAITIALAFYYGFAGVFINEKQVKNVATFMTIGQFSELGFMLLLPFGIRYLGMKFVLVIGMAAWALRYLFFGIAWSGDPFILIVLGVALHGVCFDFFLAAGFIHTENKAPASIRGSAQALFSFLTYGVGMWIGNELSGRVVEAWTVNGVKQWGQIWAIPAIGAALCLVLFLLFWRDSGGKVQTAEPPTGFPIEPIARTAEIPQ